MEAVITNINIETREVFVKTEVGSVWGKWCEDNLPKLKRYDIEIDCNDMLEVEDIQLIDYPQMQILYEEDKIYLCGLIEDVLDDVLSLRIAEDIIMLNIFSENDMKPFSEKYVCVKVNYLNFYNTGVI